MIKAVILNDTRRNYRHIGCQEVMKNIEYLCQKNNISIIGMYEKTKISEEDFFLEQLVLCDIVIVNGEGTMHDDQEEALEIFKCIKIAKEKDKRCYLINSHWQNNPVLSQNLFLFDKIFVRGGLSLREINKAGYSAIVVPDLSLYKRNRIIYSKSSTTSNRKRILYTDSVKWNVTKNLAKTMCEYSKFRLMNGKVFREIKVVKLIIILLMKKSFPIFLNEKDILCSDLIVTGRFHVLCFSLKYNIPCISILSNTHKQRELIEDIGLDVEKYLVLQLRPSDLSLRGGYSENDKNLINKYVDLAQLRIEKMFGELI